MAAGGRVSLSANNKCREVDAYSAIEVKEKGRERKKERERDRVSE